MKIGIEDNCMVGEGNEGKPHPAIPSWGGGGEDMNRGLEMGKLKM